MPRLDLKLSDRTIWQRDYGHFPTSDSSISFSFFRPYFSFLYALRILRWPPPPLALWHLRSSPTPPTLPPRGFVQIFNCRCFSPARKSEHQRHRYSHHRHNPLDPPLSSVFFFLSLLLLTIRFILLVRHFSANTSYFQSFINRNIIKLTWWLAHKFRSKNHALKSFQNTSFNSRARLTYYIKSDIKSMYTNKST